MGKNFPFYLSQLGQTCLSIHKFPVLQERAEVYMQISSDLTEKETRPEKCWELHAPNNPTARRIG